MSVGPAWPSQRCIFSDQLRSARPGRRQSRSCTRFGELLSSESFLVAARRTWTTLGETAVGTTFIAAEREFVAVVSNALQ